MDAGNGKSSDFRLSQALANQVVRKGVCGDFILCGLSPPVSADWSLVHRYTLLTSWLCQNPRLTELLQSDPKNTKAPGQMDNLLSPGFLDSQNAIYCEVVECLFDAAGPADFQIFDALIPP